MISTILFAATLFVATNIDDLFILVGFFADSKFRLREVVAGQYLAMIALIAVSVSAALAALMIPNQYLSLLGLAPIAIGCKQLWDLWHDTDDDDDDVEHRPSGSGAGRVLAVTMVTIANGGDNLGVYTPVFAVRSMMESVVICAAFLLMTAGWCYFARWMVTHPALGPPLRHYSPRVMPFVLIALGVLMLVEVGT